MSRPRSLALGWSAAMLALCSIPGEDFGDLEDILFSADKLGHIALFAVFGWLWLRAAPQRLGAVVLGGVTFGIGIEIWQETVARGRGADVYDVVADLVGLALGVGLTLWAQRRAPGTAA